MLTPRDMPADIKAEVLEDTGAVLVLYPGVMGVTMKKPLEGIKSIAKMIEMRTKHG